VFCIWDFFTYQGSVNHSDKFFLTVIEHGTSVTKDNQRVMEHVMEDEVGKDVSNCTSLTDMNDSNEFIDAYEAM